jgi:phosphonatase-like hydrolase
MEFCPMIKPNLVVFDLAGTTVQDNKDVHRVLQNVFKKMHIRVTVDEANEVMGIPKPEAIRILLERHKYPTISEMLIEEMHAHFVNKMKEFYEHHHSVREKEGASEIFHQLKENGIKVAVDTGFDRSITDPLLKRMGWIDKGLVDASVTSDEVKRGRPHADLILKAMSLTGVTDAETVAKVGDTMSDLLEGTAAGCGWVIGITTGAYSREQLNPGPHTHLIDHLSELNSIFTSQSVGISK